jgi:hypothetical protein
MPKKKKKVSIWNKKVILVDQPNNLKCSANIKTQEIVEHM